MGNLRGWVLIELFSKLFSFSKFNSDDKIVGWSSKQQLD